MVWQLNKASGSWPVHLLFSSRFYIFKKLIFYCGFYRSATVIYFRIIPPGFEEELVGMSSLSRELVFLILQFLDEEKFKETVHK